jgi:hypothetical protein
LIVEAGSKSQKAFETASGKMLAAFHRTRPQLMAAFSQKSEQMLADLQRNRSRPLWTSRRNSEFDAAGLSEKTGTVDGWTLRENRSNDRGFFPEYAADGRCILLTEYEQLFAPPYHRIRSR